MLSSIAPWCAETCISASDRESKKPHQGFAGHNLILHRGIEWSKSTLALGLPEWAGKTVSGPAVAANNGPNTPQTPNPTTTHCLGQALAEKGLSMAIDFAGSIPFVGNLVSGTAATIKAVDGVVLLGGGVVAAGNALLNSDAAGGAAAGTSIVLGVTNMAIGGTEAIPLLGNAVSFGVGIYDAAGAYSTYQRCMAGTN